MLTLDYTALPNSHVTVKLHLSGLFTLEKKEINADFCHQTSNSFSKQIATGQLFLSQQHLNLAGKYYDISTIASKDFSVILYKQSK